MAWIRALNSESGPRSVVMSGQVPYLADNIDASGYILYGGSTLHFVNKEINVDDYVTMVYTTSWNWTVTAAYNGSITNTDTGVTTALMAGVPTTINLRNGTNPCNFTIAITP